MSRTRLLAMRRSICWDERYFGGQRIWSKHDAPNDLQWDFAGIIIGALLAYVILRRGRQVEAAMAT